MNDTLMKSVLAMDAYNRGYDRGLDRLSDAIDTKIGDAIIHDNSTRAFGAGVDQAEGFYAIAYAMADGSTVISYRGTDKPTVWLWSDDGSDMANGYGVGAGSPYGAQAQMAFEFYNTIAGEGNHLSANITTTGHSLGGGLAGLVGAVYGKSGVLFNSMAFEAAAENAYEDALDYYAYTQTGTGNPGPGAEYLYTDVYKSDIPWETNANKLSSITTDGDFLVANRGENFLEANTGTAKYSLGPNVDLPGIYDGTLFHSIFTQVLLVYANTTGLSSNWQMAGEYFWPVMYDDAFFAQMGVDTDTDLSGVSQTKGEYAGIARAAIAYSALEADTNGDGLIFGNTAIHALFNDANELGQVLAASTALSTQAEMISQFFVEYASKLAFNKITDTSALKGVLSLSENGDVLTVNLTDSLWSDLGGGNNIVSKTSLDLDTDLNEIGYITFATQDNGTATSAGDADSTNVVIGGNGNNLLNGSDYKDYLFGGEGDDVLRGGAGVDSIDGGDDEDTVSYDYLNTAGTQGVNVDLTAGTAYVDANDRDTLTNIEVVIGSDQADTITGSANSDQLWGAGGDDEITGGGDDDFINGGAGSDELFGGDGLDELIGANGNDILNGNADNDILQGGQGDDTLNGGDGADELIGGDGNDTLNGNADNDNLNGGLGDDILIVGTGNDDLQGGAGFDSYRFSAGAGYDAITDSDGNGEIVYFGRTLGGADSVVSGVWQDEVDGITFTFTASGTDDLLITNNLNANTQLILGFKTGTPIYEGNDQDLLALPQAFIASKNLSAMRV